MAREINTKRWTYKLESRTAYLMGFLLGELHS